MNTNNDSNVTSRRPIGPVVRQHSLQQQPVVRRSQQQPIRRQRSTDDERSQRVRFTSNIPSKCDQQSRLSLPKVRAAWNDQPIAKNIRNETGVEIVARQIPTVKATLRPTTAGRNTTRGSGIRGTLGEKATILYSRQELAERLRLAWRQREENKSNIDIFLAHATVGDRCESSLSTPKIQDDKVADEIYTQETAKETVEHKDEEIKKEKMDSRDMQKFNDSQNQAWFSSTEPKKLSTDVFEGEVIKNPAVKMNEKENIENKEETSEDEKDKKEISNEKRSFISINCQTWNASITMTNYKAKTSEEAETSTTMEEPDFSQAKLKRASYRSGLNKAFHTPIVEKTCTPQINSHTSSIISNSSSGSQEQPPGRFRRTSSAPPQRRKLNNETQSVTDSEAPRPTSEQTRIISAKNNRPIKSAPTVKRRTKLSKRRVSANDKDEEDKAAKGGKNSLETKCGTDVVTMVSLVSSADSESEMDENSARDDKLICQLRNKLPTTPIIKSSSRLSSGFRRSFKSVSFQQDSFELTSPSPSPTNSPDEPASKSSSGASIRARFASLSKSYNQRSLEQDTPMLTAATLTVNSWLMESSSPCLREPQPQTQQQQRQQRSCFPDSATPVETTVLTDREKRCLAVPIGDAHDDKKRKLVRCRSAAMPAQQLTSRISSDAEKQSSDASQTCLRTDVTTSQQIDSRSSLVLRENNNSKLSLDSIMPTIKTTLEKEKNLPSEPYGQTPKEKECWHLYRRMCDKGVFVSFDTVLRGMLTPTEYRLRQKEVSQNC